jgi:hypothetical protein
MPLSTGGRNVLRSIAVGGALVGSLAMASSASAALAGAQSASFVNRPNLQSVTFNGLVASFHFDRAVQQIPANPTFRRSFTVGGYRASNGVVGGAAVDTANISISDPKTVLVTYTDNEVDFNANTFGAVAANTVQGFGTFATPNLADATALTGSASESGTRGHTAGPDLTSVVLDPDNNEIDFVMDQDVDSDNNPDPRNFNFYSADGVDHEGDNIVDIDDNVVTVAYTNDDIKSAQVAYVRGQVIGTGNLPQSDDDSGNPTPAPVAISVDVPGKAGATVRPKLVSATLEPNSSTVVYEFDQNIASVSGGGSNFFANAANGGRVNGSTATIIGKTVRVTFGGIDLFTEHLVSASVFAGTVVGTNGNNNLRGGKAIGGNAGAKASGWTTAPDAMSATMNPATGQVTVLFDSRIIPGSINAAGFQLLGDNGVTVATPVGAPTVQEGIGGPTQARVILQYEPTAVAVAAAIRITGGLNTGGAFSNIAANASVTGTAPTLGAGVPADSRPIQTLVVPSTTSQTFSASK